MSPSARNIPIDSMKVISMMTVRVAMEMGSKVGQPKANGTMGANQAASPSPSRLTSPMAMATPKPNRMPSSTEMLLKKPLVKRVTSRMKASTRKLVPM